MYRYRAVMPANCWNWSAVWLRNYVGWRKVAVGSLIGILADPLTNLLGLGIGLGIIIGPVGGVSYIEFLVGGIVATSVMTTATFEMMYGAFWRMSFHRTWEAMMCTELTLGDIVLGELVWSLSKSTCAGVGVGVVAAVLGYANLQSVVLSVPGMLLTGLAFGSLAMAIVSMSPSHEYFVFYQTLVLTPMVFVCGTVFPVAQLPGPYQTIAAFLPLGHSIEIIRSNMLGSPVGSIWNHIVALFGCAIASFAVAIVAFERRLTM
ncbi:Nodulation protein J (nod factor ABC-2 type transporter) [Bradyrhizobium sp. ORS 285]|uniref:ABC transporter permease n=1 Tax=Bradyrhizobium sp. ORS 285 TaxID=115808 RepID=UPI000240ABFB|nr:ABC transporter permease [Bradyrhizobium sp. ORS 285]CCA64460.1 Nodulation protein J (nod factor ABC-2 type transporter) [Bradyrhizobium sp. ORS 285]CCA64464.1 Nodulation protein J (nod factor ABC-2 type transporter) [Bradyrhizobium sp. ORS 285]CCD87678.1 Nodulation protein J (nod factor ABC-2 type transporter) [Bradyrhizobium sp. ORS 285]SMX56618.1 Nodulation protein J (nod factor ABC-2 type transporter) [Bradyrhizobium sp. ORS 285]